MNKLSYKLLAFLIGVRIGLDWYYTDLFNYKLPRWVAWIIGICLIPINWICILIMAIAFGWKETKKEILEMAQEIVKKDLGQ